MRPPKRRFADRKRDPAEESRAYSDFNETECALVKLRDYFRVPSLAHYLIADLARRHILHYRRQRDGVISVAILNTGALELDPTGLSVQVAALFGPMQIE